MEKITKDAVYFLESFKEIFPSASESNDKLWQQWVDLKKRKIDDLLAFLKKDVKEEFEARAVFLLLVPSSSWNPFYWKDELGKFISENCDFLKDLSPNLLQYARKLVCDFCKMITQLSDSDKEPFRNALLFYNHCILKLIALLSDLEAESIFQHFSLNDPTSWWNFDDSSGYNPLRALFARRDINEKWKNLADFRMREIIIAELTRKSKPRKEWEDALKCYGEIVESQLYYDEGLSYSLELFADQIKFIVSLANIGDGESIIQSWNTNKFFRLLRDERFKDLRHQLAQFVVFKNLKIKGNTIACIDTLKGLKETIAEFSERDPELMATLQEIIKDEEEKCAREEKEGQKVEKKEKEKEHALKVAEATLFAKMMK